MARVSAGVSPLREPPLTQTRLRSIALLVAVATIACLSAYVVASLVRVLALGSDFMFLWTGARVALAHPERLYDFAFIAKTNKALLGEPHVGEFLYPPSSLPLLAPFALAPFRWASGAWTVLTGALFFWAARRAGAPWWFIVFPQIAVVAAYGQTTFLVGGLILAGLSLRKREVLAGVLFGLAGAFKPQFLILLPIALVADRQWRTMVFTALTAGVLVALTAAALGPPIWLAWLASMPRYEHQYGLNPVMLVRNLTPFAWLASHGAPGAWAYALAPLAMVAIWLTFRRTQRLAERSLALIGATLLVIPYALNYEMALLAPAAAALLARTGDRRWPASLAGAFCFAFVYEHGAPILIAGLALFAWAALGGAVQDEPAPAAAAA